MSNGDDPIIVCCILGLCCPAAQQQAQWAKLIRKQHPHVSDEQAERRADKLLARFDRFKAVREAMADEA